MFYLHGFQPDVADTIQRYLLRFSNKVERLAEGVSSDFAAQDILLIDSDNIHSPLNLKPLFAITIGNTAFHFESITHVKHFNKPISLSAIGAAVMEWHMPPQSQQLPVGDDWYLVMPQKIVIHDKSSRSIPLTDKEGELLAQLLSVSPRTIDKDTLLQNVWGYDERVDTHTLETHIYRLRTKLADIIPEGKGLITGPEGYSFAL